MVWVRADAAYARRDPRHLLGRSALAELLEAPQLNDLEESILDVALVVQEDVDLGVAFQASHGVYDDFFFVVWHFIVTSLANEDSSLLDDYYLFLWIPIYRCLKLLHLQ